MGEGDLDFLEKTGEMTTEKPFQPIRIPPCLEEITPFLAVEVFQAAQRLQAQGRDVIHLEFGEPDFPTPEPVKQAALEALARNETRYTHSLGIPRLRETICGYHREKYGLEISPERVIVSQGTSFLAYMLMLVLLEPGDEVILPDPTYACYANFIRLARGVPVPVRLRESNGFQLDPAEVRRAIGPRTRGLMICSPANPTGVVMEPALLEELAGLGVPVISDEIYHGLNYGPGNGPGYGPGNGREDGQEDSAAVDHSMLEYTDNAFVLNGYSKYFAMTGWRLGYLIAPEHLVQTLMYIHQNVMISAAEFVQHAGIAAMTDALDICRGYRDEYNRRRVFMLQELKAIGVELSYEPTGAFYVFFDAHNHLRRLRGQKPAPPEPGDSLRLAMDILQKTGVALTPGCDFGSGGEGYLRLSYANSRENIAEAIRRLGEFFNAAS
ncbi:MAG: pyridoxal phosphate-dependent aminotransferase [Deltaproteobacteria bacterium]|nr:pyridoxal phosphate-dependent aminotransferase [Deltaproteobacteria bacterium]